MLPATPQGRDRRLSLSCSQLLLQATPLLHHMSAAHAYIQMFVHVCRTGQADIRSVIVRKSITYIHPRPVKVV